LSKGIGGLAANLTLPCLKTIFPYFEQLETLLGILNPLACIPEDLTLTLSGSFLGMN